MNEHSKDIGALAGARVLIVEDDPFIAMELQDLLTRCGAKVLGPVPTVSAALAIIDGQHPGAALLDVNLRGTRSTPVAAALRAAGIPFVLVTGYSRSQLDGPEMRDAPIVAKPVRPEKLVQVVFKLLLTG